MAEILDQIRSNCVTHYELDIYKQYLTFSVARVHYKYNSPALSGLGSLYDCLFFCLRVNGRSR